MQLGTIKKTRRGMSYNVGDVVLVRFPFTNLKKSKKRPVLVIKEQNELQDIVCFQITSNPEQTNLLHINTNDFESQPLPLQSFIKYDKCFTINSEIIEKKIAKVNSRLLNKLKGMFCAELF